MMSTNFDWLLVIDDDIDCGPMFLDVFLPKLRIAASGSRCQRTDSCSFASFRVTQRHWANRIAADGLR